MISKQKKSRLRSDLFRHLDGIVTCPSAFVLFQKGITKYLLKKKQASLTLLSNHFNANDGYLNVALRTLCSQGWLDQKINNIENTVTYSCNKNSEIAFNYFYLYKEAFELLEYSKHSCVLSLEKQTLQKLDNLFEFYFSKLNNPLPENPEEKNIVSQILKHIEGVIVGPIIVLLGMNNMFHNYFMQTKFKAEEFHSEPDNFKRLLNILKRLGWFTKNKETYEFTNEGLFFAKRASAYGVTVSYILTLKKLDQLIFFNAPYKLKSNNIGMQETHVDRAMNVWGSGGAHASYFKVIDEIIISLFNKPVEEQPKGILDIGCGSGAFLIHLFNLIENHTSRGKQLEEYPLYLIGIDYNQTALEITRKNLVQANIWAKVMWGDIGNPDRLSRDLEDKYGIILSDLLNVRTFLDHNRIWNPPIKREQLTLTSCSGAYAYRGKKLNNNLVIQSLKEHFNKWKPYVKKFGLLLIELHTSKPELIAKNIGKTAATAYDATHGYSDQYIVELDEYMNALKSIGLFPDEKVFKKFPNSDLATISINLFKTKSDYII
ncbi:class I SAM-dependent methyltransferase [Tenacibaculum sp. C7A-26P2]|uniref:class I SAM-dependent methyltransferase n=1 Tax=Tenacibaculum sp. C7A-26P2 TaxID=3447504 RepID=UPI003F87F56C